jgi:hypothetical protein
MKLKPARLRDGLLEVNAGSIPCDFTLEQSYPHSHLTIVAIVSQAGANPVL